LDAFSPGHQPDLADPMGVLLVTGQLCVGEGVMEKEME